MTWTRAALGRMGMGILAGWLGACVEGQTPPTECGGQPCDESNESVTCVCPEIFQPVCGKDDKTYGNACEAACVKVPVVHPGACEPATDPEPSCICPAIYKPVCGKDGKTYGNACEAACTKAPVAHEGECQDGGSCEDGGGSCKSNADCPAGDVCYPPTQQCQPECTIACFLYDPVCGSDGKTYGCGAADAHCHGAEVASQGECSAPADGCSYEGKQYQPGDSFPSSDGCNSCGCTEGGSVACTLKACVCDYAAPGRTWVAKSAKQCQVVKFACPSGQRPFFNDCGCGCESEPVKCKVGGCSGQLCVGPGDPDISTCEWREAYACYKTASCEVQASGRCGWTQTDTLRMCIEAAQ